MRKTLDTSIFQRRKNHQKSPGCSKDKDHVTIKSGVIYRFKCDRVEYDEEYIEESSRIFMEGLNKHLKASFQIYEYCNTTGHTATIDNFSIVGMRTRTLLTFCYIPSSTERVDGTM